MLKWSRLEHAKLPDTSQVTRKASPAMQTQVTPHFTATCQLDIAFSVCSKASPPRCGYNKRAYRPWLESTVHPETCLQLTELLATGNITSRVLPSASYHRNSGFPLLSARLTNRLALAAKMQLEQPLANTLLATFSKLMLLTYFTTGILRALGYLG